MTSNGELGAAQAAPSLSQLAEQIRTLNENGDRTALDHALKVGALLNQAKPLVPHGQWEKWVKETLGMPRVTAARNMRLAANVHACVHFKNVNEADASIRRSSKPRSSQNPPKRRPRESGKRLRHLYAKRRHGDRSTLMNARIRIQEVVSVLEGVGLDEYGVGDADRDTIAEVHEELTLLAVWLEKSLAVLTAHMDDLQKQETIRKLREGMNGRTDAEVATMLKIADKLERKRLAG